MKSLKAFAFCLILGISVGFAQERQGRGNFQNMTPEDRATRTVEMLDKQLSLEKSQKDSIYKYVHDQAVSDKKTFADSQGDREKMRTAMQASREKSETKIKSFLKPEQLKKYEEAVKQRPQREPRKED